MTTASTLGGQLRLDVHPADGALLVGDEPLVHAQLVEEVHTGEASGEDTDRRYQLPPARLGGGGGHPCPLLWGRTLATFTASIRGAGHHRNADVGARCDGSHICTTRRRPAA